MTRISIFAALALTSCASIAVQEGVAIASDQGAGAQTQQQAKTSMPAIITRKSDNDFSTTLEKLQTAIDARSFKTFAVIDHAKGAASVDQDLRPTTLIIFGNPQGGTPLLQAAQTLGIELPLRALVYENAAGDVMIATTDIGAALEEHGVTGKDALRDKIAGALKTISNEAATP